jgi:hypothetical protein
MSALNIGKACFIGIMVALPTFALADGNCGDDMLSMITDDGVICVPYGPGTPGASGSSDRSESSISQRDSDSDNSGPGDDCSYCATSAQ